MFHPYAILNAAAFFNIEKTYFCPHIAESANIAESAQYRPIIAPLVMVIFIYTFTLYLNFNKINLGYVQKGDRIGDRWG
jgi:hypothetical protein